MNSEAPKGLHTYDSVAVRKDLRRGDGWPCGLGLGRDSESGGREVLR